MASTSLANIFGGSVKSNDENGTCQLTGLFSDSSKQKFARIYKPEEFAAPVRVAKSENQAADESDDLETNGKKKEKRRKRKLDVAASTDALPGTEEGGVSTNDKANNDIDTVFVGNIPITETVKSINKFFRTYGEIINVRLRSVPIQGAKVDEAGNQDLVRKVCVNSKKFGEQKGSFNAYVKFKDSSSAVSALAANNALIGNRHIRVDKPSPTLFEPKRSVFLGNLPHYADEEEIREFFAKALPNGHDDIEGMRIIRDPATLVGKGIGYLLFKDRDAVLKALTLHNAVFKKRWALRVSACGKRTKRTERDKQEKATETTPSADDDNNDNNTTNKDSKLNSSSRVVSGDAFNKKARFENNSSNNSSKEFVNALSAMKRIKLKTVVTKNKVLRERKQKKDKNGGRHGKKLGGVLKRAMKAAAAGNKLHK